MISIRVTMLAMMQLTRPQITQTLSGARLLPLFIVNQLAARGMIVGGSAAYHAGEGVTVEDTVICVVACFQHA